MSRRILMLVLATVTVVLVSVASQAAQAQTQTDSGTTESPIDVREPDPVPPDASSIPRPNTGHAPEHPGDLGGGFQLLLFGLILVFPVVAVISIRRQVVRARARGDLVSSGAE